MAVNLFYVFTTSPLPLPSLPLFIPKFCQLNQSEMAKAISPRPVTGKPSKRPRRALVGKNPTRTGVRQRRGKVILKPNLSKYKHKASSIVKDLSSGYDSESQSDYGDNTL